MALLVKKWSIELKRFLVIGYRCPLCHKVICFGESLGYIQIVVVRGSGCFVRMVAICFDCGDRVYRDIERIKVKVRSRNEGIVLN